MGAGGSWHSAPSPSGPCCWYCSRGSAPRTTARDHLWATTSVGWGDTEGHPWDSAQHPHRHQALTGIWPVTEGAVFAPWAVVVGVGGLEQQSRMVRTGYAPTPHARAEEGALVAVGEGNPPQCTGRAPGTRTVVRCGGLPAPAPAIWREQQLAGIVSPSLGWGCRWAEPLPAGGRAEAAPHTPGPAGGTAAP